MGRSSVQISGTRTTAVHRGCVKTPALRLRVENLSRFRQPENKNTDDPYGGKTIEKTMLRVLRACMFSHSLGHLRPYAAWSATGCRAPKPATRRKPPVQRGFLEADVRDPVTTSTWLCPPVVARYTTLWRDQRFRYDRSGRMT